MNAPAQRSPWDQLSSLKPRLKSHLRVHLHAYRDAPWYVVEDGVNNRFHRFDTQAWRLLSCFDGELSVAEAVDRLATDEPGGRFAQAEVIALMSRLHAADLLATGLPPSIEALFKRYQRAASARWQRGLMNPLSVKVPLFDPDRLLTRLLPLVRWCYSLPGCIAWLVMVGAGVALAAEHWQALEVHFSTRALDPRNVALMWAIYPLVKLVHELGHGFAVKRWGGGVHDVGVVLLVFTPVPYVDATASTAFADKRQRMLVAGAGIFVELLLAALAMVAWLHLAPGLAKDAAFNVMLIGAGSSLLFNGNPLLRFDAYYMLADAIEIPNLGHRSTGYLLYLAQRWLLGLESASSPVTAPGERGWLVGYGAAAFCYRALVLLGIALYIAGKMFFIGVVLAVWVFTTQVLWPLARLVRFLACEPGLQGRRLRAGALASFAAVASALALGLVPVGVSTYAVGVVEAPQGSSLRTGADGVVTRVLKRNGTPVRAGEPVLILSDPLLPAELRQLHWRLRELEREHARAAVEERGKGQMTAGLRDQARAELADARKRLTQLIVRSPTDGIVTLARPDRLPGRFLRQGDSVGEVVGMRGARAQVVIPQADAVRVRRHTRRVSVRLASLPGVVLPARLNREVPQATDHLPSRALGSQGGGAIPVDARDQDGLRAMERVFAFELALPGNALAYVPGTRVAVRFEHPPAPLAQQWYRTLRQLFLARFEV